MSDDSDTRLPPGRQPYDPLVGLRVGALAGGLLGGVGAAITQIGWLILVGGVAGAVAGYIVERSRMQRETDRLEGPADGP